MQKDNQLLAEDYLQLQHKLQSTSLAQTEQIVSLKADNDSLHSLLESKINANQKLFEEKDLLIRELEDKTDQCQELSDQLDNLQQQLSSEKEAKASLSRVIQSLTEIKENQTSQIGKLLEDNNELNLSLKEKELLALNHSKDKDALIKQLLSLNDDHNDLLERYQSKDIELNQTQEQLNEGRRCVASLQSELNALKEKEKDYKRQIEVDRLEMQADRMVLIGKDKEIRELKALMDTARNEMLNERRYNQSYSNGKRDFEIEIDQLRRYQHMLITQNEGLMKEVEDLQNERTSLKMEMKRKEALNPLLQSHKTIYCSNKLNKENIMSTFSTINKTLRESQHNPPYRNSNSSGLKRQQSFAPISSQSL